ncbi:ABC transporter ATP-binding protein [Catenovulum adriaticum]|uniref:ABC transporter ATP-binding protein n=1 Tax=Catenovulum adriaticum TaxID=2984846 RepID=A0ABY7AH85_9ALTE|nr:ABC transporter ATP-binding protein [Catenovulum sp. TS8]WAJ68973.1 ABC transporter ATP-binding protein [Catenovulum sp. TS8]
MLNLNGISKRFLLNQADKVNQAGMPDPRIQGRYFQALEQISLDCKPGEVLGLLGQNGAGKTTLLRILSTALTPDQGDIQFNHQRIKQDIKLYRKQIGFLSGTTGLYERLSGYENLIYFARLYGLSKTEAANRIRQLASGLNLNDFLHRKLSEYSTGMKQRIAIARAVLHQPKLVILDEPTTGLDIIAKEVILDFITYLNKQGVSVIFSTHDMSEVSRLCHRVCLIHQGKNQFIGTIEQLKQQTQTVELHQAILSLMSSEIPKFKMEQISC